MNRELAQRSFALLILVWCAFAAISPAAVPAVGQPAPPIPENKPAGATAPASTAESPVSVNLQKDPAPLQIFGLTDGSGPLINGKNKANLDIQSHISLNSKLWVVLTQPLTLSPDKYTLFMNGSEVKGLAPAVVSTYQGDAGASMSALVFNLQRNKNNDAFWKDMLGSVNGMHVPVVVSLGALSGDGKSSVQPTIVGVPLTNASFGFEVIGLWNLVGALLAVLVVISLVWGHARTRTTLRDNLLPQIPASLQTYSLGRWQMAFWFTLIFAAFVFLFVILGDTDTISAQALDLMGISSATALAAVAVDVAKDSPADAVNRGLQALGLKTYADVLRVRQEILDRQKELAALGPSEDPIPSEGRHAKRVRSPTEERRRQLQLEIQDRDNILRTYNAKIQPFITQGWFKDITTDINGTAIHRLQAVCWTGMLGVVFVLDVYQTLAMPPFNQHLLVLMGISSAGYVGFKYPEVNS
jgi:hypothetical protein